MIREPRCIRALNETLQLLEMLAIEFVRRAEIDRHPLLDDAVLLQDRIESFQRTASINHEVLRDDFKPIDDRLLLEDMSIVRHAQTYSDSVVRVGVKRVRRRLLSFVSKHRRLLGRKRRPFDGLAKSPEAS